MTTMDHSIGVPQFFGAPPRANPTKSWHSAKKNPDGTYSIVASYNKLKNAHAIDGGDYVIQTYQSASGLAKFVGAALAAITLGHGAAYVGGVIMASFTDQGLGGFVLGMPFGYVVMVWLGSKMAERIMGRKVYIVQEKIKMKF